MAKPLLFCDFDGVLCRDRFWRSLTPDEFVRVQSALFGPHCAAPEVVIDWMKGRYTSEEVNGLLSELTGIAYERLWSVFVEDCLSMQVRPDALVEIDRLRRHYVTVLATGNMDSFERFTVPALGLDQHFDLISNSYHDGLFKTDNGGALFVRLARAQGVDLRDCVVLDDSAEVCAVASALGCQALLVTPTEDVVAHLRRLGAPVGAGI